MVFAIVFPLAFAVIITILLTWHTSESRARHEESYNHALALAADLGGSSPTLCDGYWIVRLVLRRPVVTIKRVRSGQLALVDIEIPLRVHPITILPARPMGHELYDYGDHLLFALENGKLVTVMGPEHLRETAAAIAEVLPAREIGELFTNQRPWWIGIADNRVSFGAFDTSDISAFEAALNSASELAANIGARLGPTPDH